MEKTVAFANITYTIIVNDTEAAVKHIVLMNFPSTRGKLQWFPDDFGLLLTLR